MNYTKGDWKAEHNLHGWHVACNGTGLAIHIDSEANANLIAASPDMYKACEAVQRAWAGDNVDMSYAVDLCLLAIAKAEGGDIQ